MRRSLVLFALAVLLFAVLDVSVVEACPTCKQALAGQAKYGNLPQAYMWSIIFMMSMPFLLLGSFGGYMYLQVRRARQAASQPAMVPASNAAPERELVHAE